MTKSEERNYFTAGELANLFGISKQALLYYDKIHLLSPDFISENGYRHYSVEQFLALEIIVNMRSLNISLSDIKHYLEHRSKQNFIDILAKKEAECQKVIKENERICRSLQRINNNLAAHCNLPLEQIMVCWREQRMLRMTELDKNDDGKDRIAKFARHSQLIAHNRGFVEKHAGWIVEQQNFFQLKNINASKGFFSFSNPTTSHAKITKTPLPTGLYLEIYFQGPFYKQANNLQKQISNFLEINNFSCCSDIYILPIENHWFTNSSVNYINLLFIQVKSTVTEK